MKTMKINAISHKSYGRAARKENPVWVESEDDAESLSACSLGACPVVPQERQENPLPEASQVIQEMPFEAYKQGLYMDLQDLKIPVSSAKEEAIRQGYLDGVPSPQMLRQLLQLGPRLPAVRGPPPSPPPRSVPPRGGGLFNFDHSFLWAVRKDLDGAPEPPYPLPRATWERSESECAGGTASCSAGLRPGQRATAPRAVWATATATAPRATTAQAPRATTAQARTTVGTETSGWAETGRKKGAEWTRLRSLARRCHSGRFRTN
jgi:hypothetical protein